MSDDSIVFIRETNLKPREALEITVGIQNDLEKLSNFNGKERLLDGMSNNFALFSSEY